MNNTTDPSVAGMVGVPFCYDTMTTKTLLDIIQYVGGIHGNPDIIVTHTAIYFKHEDEAIMFRLKCGA